MKILINQLSGMIYTVITKKYCHSLQNYILQFSRIFWNVFEFYYNIWKASVLFVNFSANSKIFGQSWNIRRIFLDGLE